MIHMILAWYLRDIGMFEMGKCTHNSFQEVHQDQDPDPEDQVLDEEFEEVAEEMEESDSVGLLNCWTLNFEFHLVSSY